MRLTNNFSRYEFDCKNGVAVPKNLYPNMQLLANNLQVIRDHINEPLFINSAFRTVEHNKTVGGSKNSQHLLCKAADIRCNGLSPYQLYNEVYYLMEKKMITKGGLAMYNTFMHYDVRGVYCTW